VASISVGFMAGAIVTNGSRVIVVGMLSVGSLVGKYVAELEQETSKAPPASKQIMHGT
jgi:hypothetical protein